MTLQLGSLATEHLRLADLDAGARRLLLRELAGDQAATGPRISDHIDGYGLLTTFIEDPNVTDVLVNGPDDVWVELNGRLHRTDVRFATSADLEALVERLLARAGERVDVARPVADARLPDGCRLHVAVPPVAPAGPLVSIRRLDRRWSLDELLERQMLSAAQADLLRTCVERRSTILIAGGTGTGKTTLLEALLGYVPVHERVVLVEETPELLPSCPHVVSLVARPPNEEGQGAVELPALLRAALRMRPDRIVVGEVRGEEALVALGAMSTGHPGSLLTVHASSAEAAIERLIVLAGQGARAPSEGLLRAHVESAIDVVVYLERQAGDRRVADVVVL